MYQVLLVDDEPLAKVALSNMLDWETLDCEIAGTASGGAEALKFIQQHPVDILITDLIMPQMDGLALIRNLSQQRFEGAILVLSNYSDFQLVREALLNGAQDYILKAHLNAASLQQQISQCIERLNRCHPEKGMSAPSPLPAEQAQHYREAMLSAYLLGKGLQEEMQQAVEKLLQQPPYWMFDILLEKRPPKTISDKSLRGILKLIFQECPQPDLLHLSDQEYLCLVSVDALKERRCNTETKCIQIIRQLQIYFNWSVCVLYTDEINISQEFYTRYLLCSNLHPLLFYAPFHRVLHAETNQLRPLDTATQVLFSGPDLVDIFFDGGVVSLGKKLSCFFNECARNSSDPQEVRTHIRHTLAPLLVSSSDLRMEYGGLEAAIQECASVDSLQCLLSKNLPEVIEQRIAGGTGHYKKEIKKALLFIHANYTQQLSLAEISAAVNLDKSYLCRLFKQATGSSIFQFINRLRLEKAASLITSCDLNISEAAFAVGIADALYFTRLFKKHFGISPSEYRRLAVHEPPPVA